MFFDKNIKYEYKRFLTLNVRFISWEIRQYFRLPFSAKQSSIPKLDLLSVTYIATLALGCRRPIAPIWLWLLLSAVKSKKIYVWKNPLVYLVGMVDSEVISDFVSEDWNEAVGAQNLVREFSFAVFGQEMQVQLTTILIKLKQCDQVFRWKSRHILVKNGQICHYNN